METKNILIGLGVVAIGVGAYVYLNKNKTRRRSNPNTATDVEDSDVEDIEDDIEDDTDDTDDTGVLTEQESLILACYNVGGTYTNNGCIFNDSPNPRTPTEPSGTIIVDSTNPRGTATVDLDFSDPFGNIEIVSGTNPKTGYSTNTGTSYNTGGGTRSGSTPNYNLEFSGLKF